MPIVEANKSSCELWDGVSTVNKYQFIKLVHGLQKVDSVQDLNLICKMNYSKHNLRPKNCFQEIGAANLVLKAEFAVVGILFHEQISFPENFC